MWRRWIVALSFMLGLLATVSANGQAMGPPVISKNIIRETKPVGSAGRLNCTVANLGSNKVFWNRLSNNENEKTQLISMGKDVKIQNPLDEHGIRKYVIIVSPSETNGEITYTLVVRNLVQDDDGTYQCSIMVQGEPDSTWPHRNGILFVQRPPQILKGQSTSTMTATVGDSVALECHADGRPEPNITWSRNRGTLKDPSDGEQVLRVSNSSYVIFNVTSADRGLYRCMANNNVKPPAVYMVTLLVNYKPVIRAFRNHVGQAPDKNLHAEMACKVMGYPDPVVSWWRQQGDRWIEINDDNFHRIDKLYGHGPNLDVTGSWSTLRIINVKMGAFGRYKCRGENIYGETEEYIKFFMTTTCQGSNCQRVLSMTKKGNTALNLVPLAVSSLVLWTMIVQRLVVNYNN